MIPVGVRDEDGCQFRQAGRIPSQRLVSSLREVWASARIDADQFPLTSFRRKAEQTLTPVLSLTHANPALFP